MKNSSIRVPKIGPPTIIGVAIKMNAISNPTTPQLCQHQGPHAIEDWVKLLYPDIIQGKFISINMVKLYIINFSLLISIVIFF